MIEKKKAYTMHQRAMDAEGQCLFLIAEINDLRAALAQKEAAAPGLFGDDKIDELLEPVMIAAGTSLRHYIPRSKSNMRTAMRAALAQPVAVDARIGAILAYDTKGHSKPCGQTMGANGVGQFVVIFHGTIEQSDAAAREHIRSLERAGHRFNACLLVNAEEGYHGPVITHVNANIDAKNWSQA